MELVCKRFERPAPWRNWRSGGLLFLCDGRLAEFIKGLQDRYTMWGSVHDRPAKNRLEVDLSEAAEDGPDALVFVDGERVRLAGRTYVFLRQVADKAGVSVVYVQFEYDA